MRSASGTPRGATHSSRPANDDDCPASVVGAAHMRTTLLILASGLIVLLAAWVTVALWFQAPGGALARVAMMSLWAVFTVVLLAATWRGHALAAPGLFALAFCAVLLWWHALRPSNERSWADDVARTATGEVRGSTVTLNGVRNFDWRTDDDYTPRWETRSYDLEKLESLDLITSYWSGPAIAHVLISFGFSDGEHLTFSVEIRRERGETFNELGGFFKEFELSIIAADERDIIRLRTNVRGEDDYLYRVRLPREDIRALFLAYIQQMNDLAHTPRFYNTVTVNCTTLVYHMVEHIVGRLPFGYGLLLSGYLPHYVYSLGGLDTRYTLEQLRSFGRITERARQADRSEDFSQQIRRGIPPLLDPAPATR
jgi:hypothetical protein